MPFQIVRQSDFVNKEIFHFTCINGVVFVVDVVVDVFTKQSFFLLPS